MTISQLSSSNTISQFRSKVNEIITIGLANTDYVDTNFVSNTYYQTNQGSYVSNTYYQTNQGSYVSNTYYQTNQGSYVSNTYYQTNQGSYVSNTYFQTQKATLVANTDYTGISIWSKVITANTPHQTLTDGANIDWDVSQGVIATVTLGDNRTINAPTNLKVGTLILHVIQDRSRIKNINMEFCF